MPAGADDEKIGLQVTRKINDVAYRMSGNDMSLEFYLKILGHCARSIDHRVEPAGVVPISSRTSSMNSSM
jgi:hypothetical protein